MHMKTEHITVAIEPIESRDVENLLNALSAALEEITGNSGTASFDPSDLNDPRACFAVARDGNGNALGCGAIRPLDEITAEMKRVFSIQKGRGIGKAIVQFLESQARTFGYEKIVLETRVVNRQAVVFYEKNGYSRIQNYGKYASRTEAICFEKTL